MDGWIATFVAVALSITTSRIADGEFVRKRTVSWFAASHRFARVVERVRRHAVGKAIVSEGIEFFLGKGREMNAAISNYDDNEFDYRSGDKRKQVTPPSHSRRSRHSARRRVKSPVQFNGIHRRRSKKISW